MKINKKAISRFLFFIILFSFVGCNNFIDKMNSGLQKECSHLTEKDSCIVDLGKILGFDWDVLYTFPSYSNKDTISNVIGLKYNGDDIGENETLYVFVKNNKIVYVAKSKYFKNGICFEFGFPNWPNQVNKFRTTIFKVYVLNDKSRSKTAFYRLYPVLPDMR